MHTDTVRNLNRARYKQYDWGDFIEGTKSQIQDYGLGIDLPWPGEPGATACRMKIKDHRGFDVELAAVPNGGYVASIRFPGWPERPKPLIDDAPFPGVRRHRCWWGDEYRGTADALVEAGLVDRDRLPGMPGMRKTCVTILPDGSLPQGSRYANHPDARRAGSRLIYKRSTTMFELHIRVDYEEGERRRIAIKEAEDQWTRQVRALDRPAPLRHKDDVEGQAFDRACFARALAARGQHLRLVAVEARTPTIRAVT